ncbi:MAG: OstA-like protein [Bacteroidota bacterium]
MLLGKPFYLLFFLTFLTQTGIAQKAKKIQYKAEKLYEFREKGKKIRRLVGNVIFVQKETKMYCDSSLFYVKENIMEAYGSVRIIDDSVTITSRKLIYNGQDRTAKLRENVVYTKGEQRLLTDFLDYNLDTEVGNYFNRGILKDSTNTLSSEIGYFFGLENYALFRNGVVLEAPDYTLKADTLRYNTNTKVAITRGKTVIVSEDETTLHAEGGTFRTELEQSQFIDGNVETTDYFLEGDELFFDDLKRYYDATGNVKLTAKNEDIIITGDEGYADDNNDISKVYGNAVMRRVLEEDTLYMAADTLVAIESEYDSAKRILAYNNVRMWRYNLQGLSDSASYFLQDSLLYFYDDPIFWNEQNQIEGDTIRMEISEERIKTMTLLKNAFLSSEDTIQNYNQIKGRRMVAHFSKSDIKYIDVMGNGESIYYVLEERDSVATRTMGMNRILCSNMKIRFENKKLKNISFYVQPEAKFIPPHELTAEIQKLQGFAWQGSLRPELSDVLGPYSKLEQRKEESGDSKPDPSIRSLPFLNKEGLPSRGGSLKKLKQDK